MKAHDVRHLTLCAGKCGSLLDDRKAIRVGKDFWCGKCAVEVVGVKGLKRLPASERRKLRLGDIGADAMRSLCK